MTPEDMQAIIAGLNYQDKERILGNILWQLFGKFDDSTCDIDFARTPTDDAMAGVVVGLRQEFSPVSVHDDAEDTFVLAADAAVAVAPSPYTKRHVRYPSALEYDGDGWVVTAVPCDDDGPDALPDDLAFVQTETLADLLIAALEA